MVRPNLRPAPERASGQVVSNLPPVRIPTHYRRQIQAVRGSPDLLCLRETTSKTTKYRPNPSIHQSINSGAITSKSFTAAPSLPVLSRTYAPTFPDSPFDINAGYVPRTEYELYKATAEERLNEARIQAQSLERQHFLERAKWQEKLEDAHIQRARHAAARWSRDGKAKICKPAPARREWFDTNARWIDRQDANRSNTETPSTSRPVLEPPLYDNIPDKIRQMTVDMWLLRSKIASAMEEWQAMETHSRKAQDLAKAFYWGPFVAKCAFPQGLALYKQGYWQQAHSYLQEAEKTNGYYVVREEISRWLKLASEKLHDPAVSFPERAPIVSPLTALPENENSARLPYSAIKSASIRISPSPQPSMGESPRTNRAEDSTISAENSILRVPSEAVSRSASQNLQAASNDSISQVLPAISLGETDPPAPTLSIDPRPPGLTTTPRLYVPGAHSSPKIVPVPKPSRGGKSLQLRTALTGAWDNIAKLPPPSRPYFQSTFQRRPLSAGTKDVHPNLSTSETLSPSSGPPYAQQSPPSSSRARADTISTETPSHQQHRRSLRPRPRSEGDSLDDTAGIPSSSIDTSPDLVGEEQRLRAILSSGNVTPRHLHSSQSMQAREEGKTHQHPEEERD
ncbi:MAG: hypothetical protein Q9222_003969 [Ikaeria aurantiellina]